MTNNFIKRYFIALTFLMSLFTITNTSFISYSYAGWETVPTGTTAYLTSIFFIDSNTGFIGGLNGYLSKTTNGGLNWTVQNPFLTSQFVRDISFVNSTTGYLCADDGFIRKTTDGGTTWIPQPTGTSAGIYGIDAVDAMTVFATATTGSILKSTDGGASFTQTTLTSNQLLTIDFSSRDTGYAAGQAGVVFKTTNSGSTWTFLNASTLNNFWDICALNNNDLYLAAYYGTLRKSKDAGRKFKSAFGDNMLFEDIQMVNTMIGYTCGLDGILNKTTDGGDTWYALNSNTTESLNEISFLDAKTGYVAGTNGKLLKTTDGGDGFNVAVVSPNNWEVFVTGDTHIIKWSSTFLGNAKIEYSLNNGGVWTVIQNSVPANSFSYDWLVPSANSSQCKLKISSVDNPTIFDISDGNFAMVPVNPFYNVPELVYYRFNHGIFTTPNFAVPGEIIGDADITGMTLQNGGLADSSLVGNGGSGALNFVNTNWATSLPSDGWTIGFWIDNISLGVNPNNAVYLFGDVTANNLRCYYGGAGGLTLVDTAVMFRCGTIVDVRIPVVQGQTYYIHIVYEPSPSQIKVYVNGILTQTIPQAPFLAIGNGPLTIGALATFSSSLAQDMRMDEFRVYDRPLSATEVSQTWNVTFPQIITSVQTHSLIAPENFKLYDNYPNPFNPVTKIKFDIPSNVKGQMSNVRLIVYDVLGKEVESLVNQELNGGSYEVEFNGSNLSSGIYFCKIEAGSFVDTKRMVLMK